MKYRILFVAAFLLAMVGLVIINSGAATKSKGKPGNAEHGKYLVMVGGCNHCHSPKIMTAMGPAVDTTRVLSGHRSGSAALEIPKDVLTPDKWGVLTTGELTGWGGPWGIS